jgi:hypothetical protein
MSERVDWYGGTCPGVGVRERRDRRVRQGKEVTHHKNAQTETKPQKA